MRSSLISSRLLYAFPLALLCSSGCGSQTPDAFEAESGSDAPEDRSPGDASPPVNPNLPESPQRPVDPSPQEGALTWESQPSDAGGIVANIDAPYRVGDVVELEAVPAPGYRFEGWDGLDGGNPLSLVIEAETHIVARFVRASATLIVEATPEQGGNVVVSPEGPYWVGDDVTVRAEPAPGYQFDGWEEVEESASEVSLTLSEDTTLTAAFSRIPVALNLIASPTAGGEVVVEPAGPHFYGDTVTVRAVASDGWIFASWLSGQDGFPSFELVLERDQTISARFQAVPVLSGPDTHVGNDRGYTLEWHFPRSGSGQRGSNDGFVLEERYGNGGQFLVYNSYALNDNTVNRVSIPINRAPNIHCYRVRATEGGYQSPWSNVHCVERVLGPKKIRFVNSLPEWGDHPRLNDVISIRVGANSGDRGIQYLNPTSTSLPGPIVAAAGGERTIDVDRFPNNYIAEVKTGYWDYVCSPFGGGCSYQRHTATVTGCDCNTLYYKQVNLPIVAHIGDTLTIDLADYLPDGNYGVFKHNRCHRDPLCSEPGAPWP
ncbi:MAG: hypothetical protein AAFP04_07450 [Myxococcota bacterium]